MKSPLKPGANKSHQTEAHQFNVITAGEWERSFAVITVPSKELVGQIHDRMPAILERAVYDCWLSVERDPHDLLISYPSERMTMWPISTRVNKPENDDRSILDRATEPVDWQAPLNR